MIELTHEFQTFGRSTLFVHSTMVGYSMIFLSEVRLRLEVGVRSKGVVRFEYREKNKRIWDTWNEDGDYGTVLLAGWNWPDLPQRYRPDGRALFAAFEDGWLRLFDEYLVAALGGSPAEVLLDLRSWRSSSEGVPPAESEMPRPVSDKLTASTQSESPLLLEGGAMDVLQTRHERNPEARRCCISHYGWRCQVCGMDFAAVYGEIGREFIHVHHLRPLAASDEERVVDPVRDLRPVCPNCHAMLHRCAPPLSIETLRDQLGQTSW